MDVGGQSQVKQNAHAGERQLRTEKSRKRQDLAVM